MKRRSASEPRTKGGSIRHINSPQILAEVSAAHERYEQALSENNIDVLDELFWENSLTLRYGIGENLYGHEQISIFRRKRFSPEDNTFEETRRETPDDPRAVWNSTPQPAPPKQMPKSHAKGKEKGNGYLDCN